MRLVDQVLSGIQYLLPHHLLSAMVHAFMRIRVRLVKNLQIRVIGSLVGVDWSEAERQSADDYATFNDFFIRELEDGARPIDADPASVVAPVDGTVSSAGPINGNRIFQAKGHDYTLEDLLATDFEPEQEFNFGDTLPEGFTFSPDGRLLFGSSFYTGVSNLFRFEGREEAERIRADADRQARVILAEAEREGAAALVLVMDTPGGTVQAARDIIGTLRHVETPVYTFVEQVRRHGPDPFAYFKWVFERLPGMTNQDDFAPLLPCNWVAAQKVPQEKAA